MHQLEEQSDIFVDACVGDHQQQLLFISLFGRDTSVQQFMARLHINGREGGVERLTFYDPSVSPGPAVNRTVLRLQIGDARRLTKLTGRLPRTGLLGNVVHAWIFQDSLLEVDHAARAAWLLERGSSSAPANAQSCFEQTWRLIEELSPVPLLPHWALQVVSFLEGRDCIKRPPAVGQITAARVEIPDDFVTWVSARVRAGDFTEQPGGLYSRRAQLLDAAAPARQGLA